MRSWSPILPCWSPSMTQRKDSPGRATRPSPPHSQAGWSCRNEVQRNTIISICRVN